MRIFSILALLLSTALFGQQSAYEFLRLEMSPRAAALGGSFVSANDDADIIYHNPAGLVFLEKTPVNVSFMKHLMDINIMSVSSSMEFDDIGRFGAAIQYANYGSFTEADEYGNRMGDFGAGDLALIVGYANELAENFYYGANVKVIYSSIADYSSSAAAFDVGLHYALPEDMFNFGIAIKNVGTQLSSYVDTDEDLPLDVVVGVSKRLEHLPLKLYLDFHNLNDSEDEFFDRFNAFTLGAEFLLSESFRLRIGFDNENRKELKVADFSGLAGFNAGFGLTIKEYVVNYAFSSWGEIGTIHRIGVNTAF
jgi:hypothetical protein